MQNGALSVRAAKGGKFRVVFVGNQTRKAIMRYLKGRGQLKATDPLWVLSNGKRMSYGGTVFKDAPTGKEGQSASSQPARFSPRFCAAVIAEWYGRLQPARLMGHADLTVLRRYLAQTSADLAYAHEKASPVDRLL